MTSTLDFLDMALGPNLTDRLSTTQQRETARHVFTHIADAETADIARAWMIGTNPRLCDLSPIAAIRAGRGAEVLAEARTYTEA